MAKNSGKAFELAIRKSFDAHGWWCLRITDNVYATGASVKTPADFIVISGRTYSEARPMFYEEQAGARLLIECKSTEQTSLPLSNITEFQRESLIKFNEYGYGLLLILFKKTKKCYAIRADIAFASCKTLNRKSIPEDVCQLSGTLIEKSGGLYDVDRLAYKYSY